MTPSQHDKDLCTSYTFPSNEETIVRLQSGMEKTTLSGGPLGMLDAYCANISKPSGKKRLNKKLGEGNVFAALHALTNYCVRRNPSGTARAIRRLNKTGVEQVLITNAEVGLNAILHHYGAELDQQDSLGDFLSDPTPAELDSLWEEWALAHSSYLKVKQLMTKIQKDSKSKRSMSEDMELDS
jgi:hypothetical protein